MPAYVRQNSRISLFACTRPSQDDVFTVGPHIFGRFIFLFVLNNVEENSTCRFHSWHTYIGSVKKKTIV